ncbi:MAG TPA: WD40 repeat domain-containing protein, partial [Streptosporangiaceae bacterium]|nr:WD40 repeat domain-containing protein [Streptosporangiaceae bacterium]
MHHSLTTEQPDPAATFDSRLARLGDKAQTARTLLRALAWARGPGLPPGLWRVVAGALSPGEGRHVLAVSDADLAWLLRKVRAWVETTAGPGAVTARRLREVSFAAYLRADTPSCRDDNAPPVAGTATPASAQEQHTAAVERCITGALVATVPLSATGQRDWVSADPYLRAYLAEHAAAAGPGTLSALVQDPGFLAVADPDRLAPLLGPVALDARDAVRAYRRARPMLCGDPRANAAHLAEASWGLTGPPEGDGDAVASPALYRTRLASVRRDDSLLTLAGHTSHLNEVCFGASQDGRMLLATASDDKTVRVWDTLAGELVCDPITGHDDEVWSVAFGRCPDGRLVLASSGKDATVRVWDPLTGAPLIEPITGHTERVYDVKFGTCPDGRLLLGSGSADKTARIWDPLTGAQVGEPYTGHAGRTRSVGFGRLPDGRLLFASGSPDGPARVWDPLTHSSLFTITGQLGKVWEVGFWAGPDGKLL